MAIQMFAAVYIGSYEVGLKIFEFSSKKKIHEIEDIRSRLDLGKDAFQKGVIGYELVDSLCDILAEFKTIMQGYKIKNCEVYASATLREVANELFIINQIYLRTGFEVKILSNSEHRFISYKSVAGRETFEKMIAKSAAIVDIGGSSVQITLFRQGKLLTTQHMEIGTMRLRALLDKPGHSERMYQQQIEEYIGKRLEVFRTLYLKTGVESLIFMNDYGTEVIKKAENSKDGSYIKADKLNKYIEKLQKKKLESITKELNLSEDRDPLILPTLILFKSLVNNLNAQEVWIPGFNITDGIAYDYAERINLVKVTHDFEADIISAARNLSEHYNSYSPHIEALSTLSIKIFDTMRKVHGLNRRHRLLLEIATILHDCGKYISISNGAECAYHIIMSSEIIGLSHLEREIVALTVLYNSCMLDEYEELSEKIDKDSYLVVAKLSAILRLANALDQSHRQKFNNIRIGIKERALVITVEAFEDISLEQVLFDSKTAYFEHVFSMKPVLKSKRVYNYEQE